MVHIKGDIGMDNQHPHIVIYLPPCKVQKLIKSNKYIIKYHIAIIVYILTISWAS